jgi:hypothetical protein
VASASAIAPPLGEASFARIGCRAVLAPSLAARVAGGCSSVDRDTVASVSSWR